jgi:predicted transcriptional regulator
MDASQGIKLRFNPQSAHAKKVLGPLEGDIMDVVWEQGQTTVGAVHKALRERKEIAYTTVMTTMSRLAKKRLLAQDRSSSTYLYTPVLSRADFERYVVTGILMGLFDDYGDSVIQHFHDCVQNMDKNRQEMLRDLVCT